MTNEADAENTESCNPDSWIEEHGDAMFRYAMLRVRDISVAEDLVQEAFVSALTAWDAFQGRSSVRTWLIAILRFKIMDYLRSKAKSPQWESTDHLAGPLPQRSEALKRWPTDPAKIFENKEFWLVFERCSSKLPESLADAYYLREVAQLTTEEICDQLQLTPNSLAIRIYRARVLLRDCLDRNWFHFS